MGWALAVFLGLAFLLAAISSVLYLVGVDAIGNERLRLAAERAITRLAGFDAEVTLGELRMGIGDTSLLALEVRDARIARAEDDALLASVGTLRFGLRVLPLLEGRVEIAQVSLAGATILSAGMSAWAAQEEAALVTPDRMHAAVFGAVKRAFAMTRASGLKRVRLADVAVHAAPGAEPLLLVEELDLRRVGDTEIRLEGAAIHRGRQIAMRGRAVRDAHGGRIAALGIEFLLPQQGQVAEAAFGLGEARVFLSGREGGEDGGWLAVDLRARDIATILDDERLAIDEISARIAFAREDEAFSLLASRIEAGRTRLGFQGAITPEPGDAGADAYRFELVSRDSVLAPADSPEPALAFGMRVSGRYEPAASRLAAEKIEVRTANSELMASATITMPQDLSPGITLALYVEDMPTGEAKQFWPWFAASGAREWTLQNVFGGRVRESSLHLDVPPGRLGNGVPLSDEEVSGRFVLENTRFDIAGDIPPVRDGAGWVEFSGTDVTIGLSAGTVYMPSGRTVEAGSGRLAILAVHRKPRIGKLEIEVRGAAAAMVELASYQPIDASRFHDLSPGDVSGTAQGQITADIPLQAGVPADRLAWRVALDFTNLSIAKPFEGQNLSNANGWLLVEPEKAEFSAEARLNDVPGQLHILEPLGGATLKRVRHVEMQVDDATRQRLFPGLQVLVSGPLGVVYDELPDGRKQVQLSLQAAQLAVPWIGWKKTGGTAAAASFFLEEEGKVVRLSDFRLEGDGFSLRGQIELEGGLLREARLDAVRLNPGDDFAAIIRRAGDGYSISVSGRSFDAQGIVRQVMAGAQENSAEAGPGETITVEAILDTVHGFNDESLRGVEIAYAAGKGEPERLSVRATAAGGAVQITKGGEQGRRILRVSSADAGAVLRFSNIYKHVEGGQLSLALSGAEDEALSGLFEIRDFWIVNEPRLGSLVAASSQRVNGQQVDVSRVPFERASAALRKESERLTVENGVLRGPVIGTTFAGTLYDVQGNTALTGTFLPLYGINRVFGELPLIGQILGNGPDGGLIGITYKLTGRLENPTLEINPVSAIAPGILRRIFEYR